MTAIEFCNLYNYNEELYRKFAWAKGCVGVIFTELDRFGRGVRSRFLPKEQCVVVFDLLRFVTKYNMENWVMRCTDERPGADVETIEA